MDIAETLRQLTAQAQAVVSTPEETPYKEVDIAVPETNKKPKHPLDDLCDTDLLLQVEDLKRQQKLLNQENSVFVKFLQKFDPTAIEVMETVLKSAKNLQKRMSLIEQRRSIVSRLSRRFSPIIMESEEFSAITSSMRDHERVGLRVNVGQKCDIVQKEIEESKAALDEFNKKAYKKRFRLKVDIEELEMRDENLKTVHESFQALLDSHKDRTMPLMKYIRFMDECNRSGQIMGDKFRLRTTWYKVQYQKISKIYDQKLLIGENLQEVDFEQLRIENLHLTETIGQKNHMLLELKKMNGRANLLLSQHKHFLQEKIDKFNAIKMEIRLQEQNLEKVDAVQEKVAKELEEVQEEYNKIKHIIDTYVPTTDVMVYVRKKAQLGQLKYELGVWHKRKALKEVALKLSLKELNRIKKYPGVNAPEDFSYYRG